MRVLHLALALAVAAGASATGAQTGTDRSMSMTGLVKGVSASSLTVESDGREVVFAIVSSTRFIGKGGRTSDLVLRTPEERMRRLLNSIKPDDRVTVVYRQSGTALNAVQVRIVRP